MPKMFKMFKKKNDGGTNNKRAQGYLIHSVARDGDCGYTSIGISRSKAVELLIRNVHNLTNLLELPTKQVLLLGEKFYAYLIREGVIDRDITHESILRDDNVLNEYARRINVQQAYIHYDVGETFTDAGYAHPLVLQALARIQGFELHIWQLGENQVLTPLALGGENYGVYHPENAEDRVDLLYVDNNHFERLDLSSYHGRIPKTGIYPLVSSLNPTSQAAPCVSRNALLIDNAILQILQYVDFVTARKLSIISTIWFKMSQSSELYKMNFTDAVYPYRPPLDLDPEIYKRKLHRLAKMRTDKNITVKYVGNANDAFELPTHFLTRLTQDRNGRIYCFGGNTTTGDPLQRQMLYEILYDEKIGRLEFRALNLRRDYLPRPIPEIAAAGGACMKGTSLYTFGGLIQRPQQDAQPARIYSDEFWRLENANSENPMDRKWVHLNPSNNDGSASMIVPRGRWGQSMLTYLAEDGQEYIVLYGGSRPGQTFYDIWVYSDDIGWQDVTDMLCDERPIPCARGGHSGTIVDNFLYILGGNDHNSQTFNDFWRIDLDVPVQLAKDNFNNVNKEDTPDLAWECLDPQVEARGGPEACIGQTVTRFGDFLVIYGGRDVNKGCFQTGLYFYNLRDNKWTQMNAEQASGNAVTLNRTGHNTFGTSSGMISYGGRVENGTPSSEVILLDFCGSNDRDEVGQVRDIDVILEVVRQEVRQAVLQQPPLKRKGSCLLFKTQQESQQEAIPLEEEEETVDSPRP